MNNHNILFHYIICIRSSLLTIAETTEDGDSQNGSAAEDEEEADEFVNWNADEVSR